MPASSKGTKHVPGMKDRVVKAAGRRPLNRNQIAEKLKVPPHAVARALGEATNEGRLIKTDRGYQRT